MNLIQLLPHLTELKLYDNSLERDLPNGSAPEPLLILHLRAGRVMDSCRMSEVPGWAKPIVQAARHIYG